jgi:cytoskeletal protein RodZ
VYDAYVYMGGIQKLKSLSLGKKIGLGLASLFVVSAIAGGGKKPVDTSVGQKTATDTSQTSESADLSKQKPISTVETKEVTETQAVPFESTTQNDAAMASGTTNVSTTGVNGVRTIIYSVTYTDGKETARTEKSNTVTTPPVTQVTKIGTYVAPAVPSAGSSCSGGYINSAGNCVPSPGSSPAGASARCGDGTYSYSQSRSGTCSHHGGVATWL